ncbi:hypothetical protein WJX73_000539 [Symbiochloris irregularis]|uniref:Uncharacterized protein n=1 Tax=Symbiochloris irregularis TaxID=706552 RepID=A0AAW1NNF2_9CHLO
MLQGKSNAVSATTPLQNKREKPASQDPAPATTPFRVTKPRRAGQADHRRAASQSAWADRQQGAGMTPGSSIRRTLVTQLGVLSIPCRGRAPQDRRPLLPATPTLRVTTMPAPPVAAVRNPQAHVQPAAPDARSG